MLSEILTAIGLLIPSNDKPPPVMPTAASEPQLAAVYCQQRNISAENCPEFVKLNNGTFYLWVRDQKKP